MLDDAHGRQGDAPAYGPARIPAPRPASDFVPPVTVGRPAWRARHLRLALAGDVVAAGLLPVLVLLWRHVTERPFLLAALSGVAVSAMLRLVLRLRLRWLRR